MTPWKKIDSQNGSIGYPWLFLRFSKKTNNEKRRKSTDFLLALNGL